MSTKDLGYFLIFIGALWLAFIIPIDLSMLKGINVLPVGLIIFGSAFLIQGFIDVELVDKLLGYLFLIFIVLFIRANGFFLTPWTFFTEPSLTEEYNNSFIIDNGSVLNLGCDACSLHLMSSPDNEVKAFMNHDASSSPIIIQESGFLSVSLKQDKIPMSGGFVNYSIPSITGDVALHLGVGSIEVNLLNLPNNAYLNISTGAGSINLTNFSTLGFKEVYLDTGVGSIDVLINGVNGSQVLELNTGVGSVELFVKPGLIVQFDLSTGLGSVSNNYGSTSTAEFNSAVNRLIVKAHTGIGSVDINLLIESYDDCVAAGYPIMESYPEQCSTPDGRTFTNIV